MITLIFNSCIAAVSAQTTTATQNLSLTLTNLISLYFVSTGTQTGSTSVIPFSGMSDYANGVPSSDQQMVVQSNKLFNITMNASSANFTYSGTVTPAPVMPITNVLYIEPRFCIRKLRSDLMAV